MIIISSEAQRKAVKKYQENMDSIRFHVDKGSKERFNQKAKEKGYSSLTKYIIDLLERA